MACFSKNEDAQRFVEKMNDEINGYIFEKGLRKRSSKAIKKGRTLKKNVPIDDEKLPRWSLTNDLVIRDRFMDIMNREGVNRATEFYRQVCRSFLIHSDVSRMLSKRYLYFAERGLLDFRTGRKQVKTLRLALNCYVVNIDTCLLERKKINFRVMVDVEEEFEVLKALPLMTAQIQDGDRFITLPGCDMEICHNFVTEGSDLWNSAAYRECEVCGQRSPSCCGNFDGVCYLILCDKCFDWYDEIYVDVTKIGATIPRYEEYAMPAVGRELGEEYVVQDNTYGGLTALELADHNEFEIGERTHKRCDCHTFGDEVFQVKYRQYVFYLCEECYSRDFLFCPSLMFWRQQHTRGFRAQMFSACAKKVADAFTPSSISKAAEGVTKVTDKLTSVLESVTGGISVTDAHINASSTVQVAASKVEEVTNTFQMLGITAKASYVLDSILATIDTFKSIVFSTPVVWDVTSFIIDLVLYLIQVFLCGFMKSIPCLMMFFSKHAPRLAKNSVLLLVREHEKWFRKTMHTQAFEFDMFASASALFSFFTMIGVFFVRNDSFTLEDFIGATKYVSSSTKVICVDGKLGVTALKEIITEIFEDVGMFFGYAPMTAMGKLKARIKKFKSEVEPMLSEAYWADSMMNVAKREHINNLAVEGLDLDTTLKGFKDKKVHDMFQASYALFKGFHKKILDTGASPIVDRARPVCVFLQGSAGCGKSTAAGDLMKMLMLFRYNVPYNAITRSQLIYTYQGAISDTDAFMSGLMGSHKICLFSDYGTRPDNINNPSLDASFLMKMIDTAGWKTPQAELPAKGRIGFESIEFVIVTTNIPNQINVLPENFQSKAAVNRRVDFFIDLQLKDFFKHPVGHAKAGQLDMVKKNTATVCPWVFNNRRCVISDERNVYLMNVGDFMDINDLYTRMIKLRNEYILLFEATESDKLPKYCAQIGGDVPDDEVKEEYASAADSACVEDVNGTVDEVSNLIDETLKEFTLTKTEIEAIPVRELLKDDCQELSEEEMEVLTGILEEPVQEPVTVNIPCYWINYTYKNELHQAVTPYNMVPFEFKWAGSKNHDEELCLLWPDYVASLLLTRGIPKNAFAFYSPTCWNARSIMTILNKCMPKSWVITTRGSHLVVKHGTEEWLIGMDYPVADSIELIGPINPEEERSDMEFRYLGLLYASLNEVRFIEYIGKVGSYSVRDRKHWFSRKMDDLLEVLDNVAYNPLPVWIPFGALALATVIGGYFIFRPKQVKNVVVVGDVLVEQSSKTENIPKQVPVLPLANVGVLNQQSSKTENVPKQEKVLPMRNVGRMKSQSVDPTVNGIPLNGDYAEFSAQFLKDETSNDIRAKIWTNAVVIYGYNDEVSPPIQKRLVNGTFVHNLDILTVDHLWAKLQEYNKVRLYTLQNFLCGEILVRDLKRSTWVGDPEDPIGYLDAMVLHLDKKCGVAPRPSLLKYFAKYSDIMKFAGCNAVLTTIQPIKVVGGQSFVIKEIGLLNIEAIDQLKYDAYDGRHFLLRKAYRYRFPTQQGDCGSLLVGFNPNLPRKILGEHVCGDSADSGCAVPICQEVIMKMCGVSDLMAQMASNDSMFDHIIKDPYTTYHGIIEDDKGYTTVLVQSSSIATGAFINYGRSYLPRVEKKSQTIFKSPLADHLPWENNKLPAITKSVVKDGIKYDPIEKGIKKLNHEFVYVADEDLKAACEAELAILESFPKNIPRMLTIEEAVFGVGKLNSVNVKSSPGGKYKKDLKEGNSGKHQWIDLDKKWIAESLIADVDDIIDKWSKGDRSDEYYTLETKTELRTKAKADPERPEDLSTRLFSCPNMDANIAGKRLFGGFINHITENNMDLGITVGLDVHSQFAALGLKMTEKGNKVFAGDFEKFDGSLFAKLILAVLHYIIIPWFEDTENNRARETWAETCCFARYVMRSLVVMCLHGNPSGNILTTIINSLCIKVCKRLVWMKIITPDEARQLFPTMSCFDQHVFACANGDDNVVNITDVVAPFYNQHTVSAAYKDFGMTYTAEDKSSEVAPYRKLTEVTFLKRSFCCEKFGQLSKETITEMPMWLKKGASSLTNINAIIADALMEASYWGEEYYNWYAKALRFAIFKSHVLRIVIPSYYQQLRERVNYNGGRKAPVVDEV
jgi:hypothetical protein